jgi:cytochrome c556
MTIRSIFVVTLSLAAFSQLYAHTGASGVVKERMDNFKQSKASMKAIKTALRASDFDTIASEASSINTWANNLVEHFPEGSNPPPSEALGLIWEEFEQFKDRAGAQIDASFELREAAESRDIEASTQSFSDLAQSCKACHDDYRE